MSSILKALKRLERDQSRHQDDNVDLARDILRGDGRRFGPPVWLLPLLALLVLLLGLTLGILLWPRRSPLPVPAASAALSPPVVTAPAPKLEPAIVEELVDHRRPALLPLSVAAPAPSRRPAAPPPQALAAAKAVPPLPAPVATPSLTAAPETALLVSMILFQDEPSARIAVVNELPVMEGTMIGELRVEEIRPDRVIFSRQGVRFAVLSEAPSP